jgi:4a-hydroxytetrahydrobiopterin dehydratase
LIKPKLVLSCYQLMDNNWIEEKNSLNKTFVFSDFLSAINWMQKAAPRIEASNHHPEWTNIYNKVHVKLCTHDAQNTITEKDRTLANLLDSI